MREHSRGADDVLYPHRGDGFMGGHILMIYILPTYCITWSNFLKCKADVANARSPPVMWTLFIWGRSWAAVFYQQPRRP